jgi:hypothetical protein
VGLPVSVGAVEAGLVARRAGASGIGGEDFHIGVLGVVGGAAMGTAEAGEVRGGGGEGLAVADRADEHQFVAELIGDEEYEGDIHALLLDCEST